MERRRMARKSDGVAIEAAAEKGRGRTEAGAAEAPPPARKRRPRPKPSASERLARRSAVLAIEKKAIDPVVLDLREKSGFTDFFVIASGTSDRHVRAIAAGIGESLAAEGIRPMGIEGEAVGQWVLIDYADVVVHVFYSSQRMFYDLESLWVDAPRLDLGGACARKKRRTPAAGQRARGGPTT